MEAAERRIAELRDLDPDPDHERGAYPCPHCRSFHLRTEGEKSPEIIAYHERRREGAYWRDRINNSQPKRGLRRHPKARRK